MNGISVPAGDLLGNVTWGIQGIPYVISSGIFSVGASPVISSITPAEVQQSQTIDAVVSGTRLSGAGSIGFDAVRVTGTLRDGGGDTSLPVRITASASQPLGNVPFTVLTAAGLVRYAYGINIIALKPTLAVNSITPAGLRRAETKSFQISGSWMHGATLSASRRARRMVSSDCPTGELNTLPRSNFSSGIFHSAATALALRLLPQPGTPTNNPASSGMPKSTTVKSFSSSGGIFSTGDNLHFFHNFIPVLTK